MILNYDLVCFLYVIGTQLGVAFSGDNDYNVVHRDGSYEFGSDTPDSYHYADANRKNIVRGEFGGRNPKTGGIDSVVYTAGPRGFRPRGKNIARKYDLSQSGARPIGSPNDPYYDPYEDPSYSFGFRTRTQSRTENANRVGDVAGKYSFVDDVGERHNVEYIAGKNTGFHVKTPFPDSNPRAYGPLYFRGRGRPIPRGRTSIQRGLDGSYKFVSAGPDQRRTETSDSTGHVRGSYTYLDDKGVQHSVHYIAGPETGYRVLKNVKGPHLPTVFPFGTSGIIPPDFYDDYEKDVGDVFDTAGHVKPINNNNVDGTKPGKDKVPTFGDGVNIDKDDYDIGNERPGGGSGSRPGGGDGSRPGGGGGSRPGGGGGSRPGGGGGARPGGAGGSRPGKPGASDDYGDDEGDYDLFGGGKPQGSGLGRPSPGSTQRPPGDGSGGNSYIPPKEDNGSFRPGSYDSSSTARPDSIDFESNEYGSSKPGSGSTTKRPVFGDAVGGKPSRPGSGEDYFPSKPKPGKPTSRPGSRPGGSSDFSEDYDFNDVGTGVFGGGSSPRPSSRPSGGFSGTFDVEQTGESNCRNCQGTIVTNVGDRTFLVPPGISVRAHVQAIDLQPLESKVLSPSEQFRIETNVKTEQLNLESDELVGTTIESKTTISPALDSSKEETSKSDEDNTTIATNEENS